MKYIFEHMLEAVIIGAVVLGLLFLLNNIIFISKDGQKSKGILNIISTQFKMQNSRETTADNSDFLNIVSQDKPEIIYSEKGLEKIKSNNNIEILNYFKVKFADNPNMYDASALDSKYLSILNVTDVSGSSMLSAYNTESKTILFPESGCFTIEFCISDIERRTIVAAVKIPVDG